MSHCPQPQNELLAIVAPTITWVLVLIGWIVVHWTTARRARRQEELGMLAAIEKRVIALRDLAVSYYTSPASDSDSGTVVRLKLELKSIVGSVRLLRKRQPNGYEVEGDIIGLRQAVTGGMFESGSKVRRPPDDEKVQNIWSRVDDLLQALQGEFERVNRGF